MNESTPVHPSHYSSGGIEAIDVIDAFSLDFNLGNVVKYVLRARLKGKGVEDLEKAEWYLKRALKVRQPKDPSPPQTHDVKYSYSVEKCAVCDCQEQWQFAVMGINLCKRHGLELSVSRKEQ
jgi:hypothetical protein